MTDNLSVLWTSLAPAIGNHLWQSTLVALVAGALTLLLRKHHARTRYWLWLAASVKFLVPFSLFTTLGTFFARQPRNSLQVTTPQVYFTLEEISRPFTPTQTTPLHTASPTSPTLAHYLPWLAVIWFAGFLAVLLLWAIRWQRISAAMKSAVPLPEGRELEMLRRMERIGSLRPIPLLLSRASLEPGIFGIARPVLLWPEGISEHLHDEQLEAILAHEVWHVRRRDNLYAVLHMFVEALFWFYPPVWWLGLRLVDERERACDEEVIAAGSARHVYAESILKVCEFCLGSPLPCVAGVTGADLKKRMVHIMNDRILHKLDFARKALLTVVAFLAIAIPITFGLLHATPGSAQSQAENAAPSVAEYSSVSINPSSTPNGDNRTQMMFSLQDGSFVARGVTLERLIQMAYHVQDAQISGPHDTLNKSKFDIEAKLDPSAAAAMHQQTSDGKNLDDQAMLKSLLADRFKLVVRYEPQTVAAYDLVADENGAKLQPSAGQQHMFHLGRGELTSTGAPLELLTAQLSARLGKPVVDKTGLKGTYAFNLHWTPDPSEDEHLKQSGEPVDFGQRWSISPQTPADANGPSLMTALQEQLGLKLEPRTESVRVLVIEHFELPSEN